MMALYDQTSYRCSKIITQAYSTSFSLGILTLDKKFRNPIYAIYGYVRYADEIVDTFHQYDKRQLLQDYKTETYKALCEKISINPVLHSFQKVVHQYRIPYHLIDAFLKSMEMDLEGRHYDDELYNEYIYGSAEVVGLMCLKVFCEGNEQLYENLKSYARSLGAAFQKVNFLRDMKSDYFERGRVYFPGIKFDTFNNEVKKQIEEDIQNDFDHALVGIMQLPRSCRYGVYLAYKYYLALFNQIKRANSEIVMQERIRVSDAKKMRILVNTYLQSSLNLL
jgi:phytoene/squalene synthetase